MIYARTMNPAEYARLEDQARCARMSQVAEMTDWILSIHGPDINCFTFHLELKRKFPFAKAWYDGGHVLTEIDGKMYDKTGVCLYPLNDAAQFERAFGWEKE